MPKFREDIREIAELTSDDELRRIAELAEVLVSLEHLRDMDPQTRILVGYRLDVTPAESPRLRRRLASGIQLIRRVSDAPAFAFL
jgi:hypothetical protein